MSFKFDAPLGPSDTISQTPQWNVDTLSDPFGSFRNEFWQRTAQPASSSSGVLSSLSKPQTLLGDALIAGGFASRLLNDSPISLEMSWGLTAAGRVLSAYTQSEHNSAETAALLTPPHTVPSNNSY